jgi:hypothetical protein
VKSRFSIGIAVTTLFATLAIPAALAAQNSPDHHYKPVVYSLTVLGTLGGDSEAHGLNNRGSVPGQSFLSNAALHAIGKSTDVSRPVDSCSIRAFLGVTETGQSPTKSACWSTKT